MVVVGRVQVVPVAVVGVAGMLGQRVATARPMDVHVAAMRQVEGPPGREPLIDVVAVGMVEVPIVEVVEMVAVGHLRVPAPPVVEVGVRGVRLVRPPSGRGDLRGHRCEPWWHAPAGHAGARL